MKQLLFLLLFPCLALAQYTGNAGQKITLGEQTSADGLVYRGVANDTNVITPFSDTSAYIILDTVDSKFYHYNRTTTYWALAGGGVTSFSAGSTGLTPSGETTGAVTLSGTLAVANGGTGADMSSLPNNFLVRKNSSGVFDTSAIFEAGGNVGIGTASPSNPLSVVSSGGSFLIDNNGQFTTKQNLDVAGSGARWTAQSGRGTLGRIAIEQVTTGADGGQIIFQTIPSGSTTLTERLRILQNGFVGIGTNNPQFRLDVQNPQGWIYVKSTTGTNDAYFRTANTGGDGFFGLESSTGGNVVVNGTPYSLVVSHNSARSFHLGTNNTVRLTVNSIGDVGIGTTTPTEALHVDGNARITGLANAANPVNVQVDVNGVLVRTSSIDIKEDVQSLPYGLNEVMLLQPSKFSYIDKYKYGEGYDIGFIAEDVNNVIPEAVGTGVESDVFMDSVKLIPVLTKAIQEQNVLIKALEQRIINLENK